MIGPAPVDAPPLLFLEPQDVEHVVKALLDTTEYEPGQKIADDQMRALQLKPHAFHGDWNYTLEPRRTA